MRGTEAGTTFAASSIHATSLALRETGAVHSWATRSRAKAFFTTKAGPSVSTFQMSDATPPVSGINLGSHPTDTRPERIRNSKSCARSLSKTQTPRPFCEQPLAFGLFPGCGRGAQCHPILGLKELDRLP